MKNPFPDNPVFQKFLGLKDVFRQYTTRESQRRTKELAYIARLINSYGDKIAFDILGSVNFGIADDKSDVDMVIYIDCGHEEEATYENCYKLWFYERLILNTLVHEVAERTFNIEVVDAINLKALDKAIRNEDYESDIIARFVFYRTICRGINKKVIREYERRIMNNTELFHKIEDKLTDALVMLTTTSTHTRSFNKYIQRLKENNLNLPASILDKVKEYVNVSATQNNSL